VTGRKSDGVDLEAEASTLPTEAASEPEAGDLRSIAQRLAGDFEAVAGKRVLVTGGAGFLGYYLTRSILHWNGVRPDASIDLSILDNFIRGIPAWIGRLEGRARVVRHDISEPLPAELPDADYILHAASIASPVYYRLHPIETMDANVEGLRSLLEHCRARKATERPVSGFLFFSSSEIYGDPTPEHIPTPESYTGNVSCTGPRACYDESKRYGETLAVNFQQQFDLPIKIVRPFNNYGPGLKLDDGRLIPDFASSVLAGRDIEMYSDGSPTRTFCYVSDAVVGFYRALLHGRPGEPYNIGSDGPEISVLEVAEKVTEIARETLGYGGRVVRRDHEDRHYLTDNPNRRCPNIEKARREIGFAPEVGLDEGLRRALLWYRIQSSQSGEGLGSGDSTS